MGIGGWAGPRPGTWGGRARPWPITHSSIQLLYILPATIYLSNDKTSRHLSYDKRFILRQDIYPTTRHSSYDKAFILRLRLGLHQMTKVSSDDHGFLCRVSTRPAFYQIPRCVSDISLK